MRPSLLWLVLACLLFTTCKKNDNPNPADQGEQLPPITQEGKNTFGCLLNGQVWLPGGNFGTPNFRVNYDPSYDGGTFDLRTYRYLRKDGTDEQYIIMYANNIMTTGTYNFSNIQQTNVSLNDRATSCYYDSRDELNYAIGSFTITKFDETNRIIAGTFEFILAKPGCDTIRVTQGRFDKRF